LIQKNEAKKNQDCARFARKISARTAKSSKLATSLLKQGRLLTLFSLIFRLTGRGRLCLLGLLASSQQSVGRMPTVPLFTCLSYGQSRGRAFNISFFAISK